MLCSRTDDSGSQAAKDKASGTEASQGANPVSRIPCSALKSRLETLQITITTIDNEAEFSNAVELTNIFNKIIQKDHIF